MNEESYGWYAFITGILVTILVGMSLTYYNRQDISPAEFYRFCMAKSIPLEQCKTPPLGSRAGKP